MIQEEKPSANEEVLVSYNADLGYPEMFLIYPTDPNVMDGFYRVSILSFARS